MTMALGPFLGGAGAAGSGIMGLLSRFLPSILGGAIGGLGGLFGGGGDTQSGGVTGGRAVMGRDYTSPVEDVLGWLIPGTQWSMGEATPAVAQVSNAHGGIARQWYTGTCRFFLLGDGSMASLGNNGVVRWWKPRGPIVLSREPTIAELSGQVRRVQRLARQSRRIIKFAFPNTGRRQEKRRKR